MQVTRFDFEQIKKRGHIHEMIMSLQQLLHDASASDGTETVSKKTKRHQRYRISFQLINISDQKMSFIEIEFKKSRVKIDV